MTKGGEPVDGQVAAAAYNGASLKRGEEEGEWKVTIASCKYFPHFNHMQVVRRKGRKMQSAKKCLHVVPGLPVTGRGSRKTARGTIVGQNTRNDEKKNKVFMVWVIAQPRTYP